jgi:hypothetical protein
MFEVKLNTVPFQTGQNPLNTLTDWCINALKPETQQKTIAPVPGTHCLSTDLF